MASTCKSARTAVYTRKKDHINFYQFETCKRYLMLIFQPTVRDAKRRGSEHFDHSQGRKGAGILEGLPQLQSKHLDFHGYTKGRYPRIL